MTTLYSVIENHIKENNITFNEFAIKAGLSRQTLYNVKNSKPTEKVYRKIGDAMPANYTWLKELDIK